ncbi:MAG: hypothetical protein ACTSXX_10510 [Candidatus Baldrarchaeia archaeon]
MKKEVFCHILALSIFTIIAIFSWRKVLFMPGLIEYRDLNWPYDLYLRIHEITNVLYLDWAKRVYLLPLLYLGIIFSLDAEIMEKFLFLLLRTLTCFSFYVVTFKILKEAENNNINLRVISGSIISGFLAILNPIYISMVSVTFAFALSYALLPLVIYYYDLYVREPSFKLAFVVTILLTIIVTSTIQYLCYVVIIISIWTALTALLKEIDLFDVIKRITMLIPLFFAFSAYWILPSLVMIIGGQKLQPEYVLTYEILKVFSRPSFLDVMMLRGDWWPRVRLTSPPWMPQHLYLLIGSVYPFLALSSLLFIQKIRNPSVQKFVLKISVLTIVFLFLNKGLREPFGETYLILYKIPLIGWMFRVPSKFAMILATLYVFLISISLYLLITFLSNIIPRFELELDKKIRIFSRYVLPSTTLLGLFFIGFCIIIISWPIFTGDMGGTIKPEELPPEYLYLNKWLESENELFNIVVIPHPPPWGLPKPTIKYNFYWQFSIESLLNNETKRFGALLSPWGVKYIIVRTEFGEEINKYIVSLMKQRDIKLIKRIGLLYVFENLESSPPIFIPKTNLIVLDNMKVLNSLTEANILTKSEISTTFLSQSRYRSSCEVTSADAILIVDDINILYLYLVFRYDSSARIKIIKPFDATYHHEPSSLWSRAMTSDPLHGDWHTYLKNFGIENWQFDYNDGLIFTWASNATLSIPFHINDPGNYKVFIRYFENQEGGEIRVYLDERNISIKTIDQLNKFVWKDIGSFYFKAGDHEIILKNIKGFNAVNLFLLIPEKEYFEIQEKTEKLLSNKTIIYLLEAEDDLYRLDAKIANVANASNGKILILNDGSRLWQDVIIIKEGTYKLALKGQGTFKVSVGEMSFILTSNGDFVYSPLFDLMQGKYKIEITPVNTICENTSTISLDVIWLYSASANQTIDQLLKTREIPAKIISYERISPTHWQVEIIATRPFILAFAEAYNPLWEARVYKSGKLVERVRPIPLYSIINGFYIKNVGTLKIIIKFTPQEYFGLGLGISLITAIGCIVYSFYDSKRAKKYFKKIRNTTNFT